MDETATRECPSCKSQIRPDASVCPHCQRESEPWTKNDDVWWMKGETGEWVRAEAARGVSVNLSGKNRKAALTVGAGASLAVVGSFLPWLNVTTAFGSVSKGGLEGGDGIIILIVAVLVGLGVASRFGSHEPAGIVSYSALIGALVIGGVTVYDHIEVNERVSTFQSEAGGMGFANVGPGIWVLYVAAALMAVGWWTGRQQS